MSESVVILPVTTPNNFLWYMACVAMRTLRASTDSRVLLIHNNTPDPDRRRSIEKQSKALKFDYEYWEKPYSQSKVWNHGMDVTTEEYIALANQDSIFFYGWLENMVKMWKRERHFFALWPWSYSEIEMGLAYPTEIRFEDKILATHQPQILLLLKRSNGYRWDENLPLWELDADFMHYVTSKGLPIGLCLNARVDHFNQTVSGNIDMAKHYGFEGDISENFYGPATAYLKKKWNLP